MIENEGVQIAGDVPNVTVTGKRKAKAKKGRGGKKQGGGRVKASTVQRDTSKAIRGGKTGDWGQGKGKGSRRSPTERVEGRILVQVHGIPEAP
jgi:hypothetical protein